MKKPVLSWSLALLAGVALAFPPGLSAQTASSAGTISRLIPAVNLQHGTKTQLAAPGTKVVWGDRIVTDTNGRARVALDDGSILNVGSGSSLAIVQHDANTQRTQIELAYGRLRASAIKLAKADSRFEVRTPTAVAGVVGTEFDLSFVNDISSLSVDEGSVSLCNLGGQCVTVGAGFTSTVRGNSPPSQPVPTAPTAASENLQSTSVGGGAGGAGAAVGATAAATHSIPIIATIIAAVVVPAAVIPATTHTKKCGCTTVP